MTRQYCGQAWQGGQLPGWDVPGLRQSAWGRALVDKRLYLPKSWTSDPERCAAAGVPEERQQIPVKDGVLSLAEGTELALELLERAIELGHLRAGWVAADDAFGMSPSFREGLGRPGNALRAGRASGSFTVWPVEPEPGPAPVYPGTGRPSQAQTAWMDSGAPWSSAGMSCPLRPGGR